MRLWSIHPKYLDPAGLVALWREGLLAKKVLLGHTVGYRHHPQLLRFRSQSSPVASINAYLYSIWVEADQRGYSFDKHKIGRHQAVRKVPVTSGQTAFELQHLRKKLKIRNKRQYRAIAGVKRVEPHPLFKVRSGPVEGWENVGPRTS